MTEVWCVRYEESLGPVGLTPSQDGYPPNHPPSFRLHGGRGTVTESEEEVRTTGPFGLDHRRNVPVGPRTKVLVSERVER